MPRYVFNLYNDITAIDAEGSDWADDAAALVNAREIASVSVQGGKLDFRDYIEVLADDGRRLGIISFGDAVKVVK